MEQLQRKKDAVDFTPKDHPDRAKCLNNLGNALQRRFERTGAMEDLNGATSAMEEAVDILSAPPTVRIAAAINAAKLLDLADAVRASRLLKIAVELLPAASPRALQRSDQQYTLSAFAGVASAAAATLLQAGGSALEALQLLELGRGVMSSLLLDMRTDITLLEESHPAIAEQFKNIRDELDPPIRDRDNVFADNETLTDLESQTTRRHTIAKEFQSIVDKIRTLKGFERFLLGPSEDNLMAFAVQGPIVILNVASARCDAFLVTIKRYQMFSAFNITIVRSGKKARKFVESLQILNSTTRKNTNRVC